MLELTLNTSDAVLLGSDSTLHLSNEIINKYYLDINLERLNQYSHENCLAKSSCKDAIGISDDEIINGLYNLAINHTISAT